MEEHARRKAGGRPVYLIGRKRNGRTCNHRSSRPPIRTLRCASCHECQGRCIAWLTGSRHEGALTMLDFGTRMLTQGGIAVAHQAMLTRYCWFEHIGDFAAFDRYCATGIERRNPGMEPEYFVTHALGPEARNVVCLRPIDSTLDTTPRRRARTEFRMAPASVDLPRTIGLDWSFGGVFALADQIRRDCAWEDAEVFVEVTHRRGSVLSYAPIPIAALRVWTMGSSTYNPATWPRLIGADRNYVERWETPAI
jgi:hypothetical protein